MCLYRSQITVSFPLFSSFREKHYAFVKHCAALVKKKRINTLRGSHFSFVHCLSKLTLEFWQLRYMERKFAKKPLFCQRELGGRQICRPNWSFIIDWGIQIIRDSNVHIKRHHESPGTRIIYSAQFWKESFDWLLPFTITQSFSCVFYYSSIQKNPTFSTTVAVVSPNTSSPVLYRRWTWSTESAIYHSQMGK